MRWQHHRLRRTPLPRTVRAPHMSRLRHAAQHVAGRNLRPRLGRITAHERRPRHPPHAALPAAPRVRNAAAVASLCGRNSTPAREHQAAEQARAPRAQWRESARGTLGHGTRPPHEAHGHQVRTTRTRGASGALPATAESLAAALDIKDMRIGGWGKRWERE